MTVLVASTMAQYVTDKQETSLSWLANAEAMQEAYPDIHFFGALEVNDVGLEGLRPFHQVGLRITGLGGVYWKFSYGDYRDEIGTWNRLRHICAGRNMIQDYAMEIGASHILFLDADMMPPPDCIPKLLEMNWPLVGGHVPTYDLSGPSVHTNRPYPMDPADETLYPPSWNVQEHMNTAGFLMVERQVFNRVRWRYSSDNNSTDDPCYERDAREFLGFPTFVRHDVVGVHYPESIIEIENRFPERNMKVKQW